MKILFLTLILAIAHPTVLFGQQRLSRWGKPIRFFIEGDTKFGQLIEKYNSTPLSAGYSNALNYDQGNLNFTSKESLAGNMQFGYFLDKKKHFGVGVGIMYLRQSGNLEVDTLHVEYMANDNKGNVFRQVVSSVGPMSESITISSLSVPLFVRYKKEMHEDLFFTCDAGVLFNLLSQYKYAGDATFDYEAIYKFEGNSANPTSVYDGSPTPGATDWLITKAQFLKTNPNGNIQAYFNSLQSIGYNVGYNVSGKNSGKINYRSNSLGIIVQPALSYKISSQIYGKGGFYFIDQTFQNHSYDNTVSLTNKPGIYNSLLSFNQSIQNWTYGVYFGVSYYL